MSGRPGTRWNKLTVYDRVPEMVAFYNADPTRAYRDVAEHFGCSHHYVKLVMGPFVQPRGKMRKDGTRHPLKLLRRGGLPVDTTTAAPLMRRRVARIAERLGRLDQDPDVMRCRAERVRFDARHRATLDAAKRELQEMEERHEARAHGAKSPVSRRRRSA